MTVASSTEPKMRAPGTIKNQDQATSPPPPHSTVVIKPSQRCVCIAGLPDTALKHKRKSYSTCLCLAEITSHWISMSSLLCCHAAEVRKALGNGWKSLMAWKTASQMAVDIKQFALFLNNRRGETLWSRSLLMRMSVCDNIYISLIAAESGAERWTENLSGTEKLEVHAKLFKEFKC